MSALTTSVEPSLSTCALEESVSSCLDAGMDVELEGMLGELEVLRERARPRLIRNVLEWALQEFVIPDGPEKGKRLRLVVQPWAGLFLYELTKGCWRQVFATGTTQAGKTLICSVVPVMYHLFELGENFVFGIPNIEMANDKWNVDLRPAIEASRYRDLMPLRGEGSRGGNVRSLVKFTNGAGLKFMSKGGENEKRSGFTVRGVAITEADKMDKARASSDEGDAISQIIARTDSFDDERSVYAEGTLTTSKGRTSEEIKKGSNSRIACHCALCDEWVTPEREHLQGWQEGRTEMEARALAFFCCPKCGGRWSDEDRVRMNRKAVLLHGEMSINGDVVYTGQRMVRDEASSVRVADGSTLTGWRIDGGEPPTFTLGFRYNAFNNLFWTAASIAAREWNALSADDKENAKKVLHQFVWALPYDGENEEIVELSKDRIAKRHGRAPKGTVPVGAQKVALTVDVGKRFLHWTLLCGMDDGSVHVADYGVKRVYWEQLGGEKAIEAALQELDDESEKGWPATGGGMVVPDVRWVDSGNWTKEVYGFVKKSKKRWQALKGYGTGQNRNGVYTVPKRVGKDSPVKHVGDGFHLSFIQTSGIMLREIDVDHWKGWVHRGLAVEMPEGKIGPGCLTFYEPTRKFEHYDIAEHCLSEKQVEEFVVGRGTVVKWVMETRRPNHWFDCLGYGGAALSSAGWRAGRPPVVKKNGNHGKNVTNRTEGTDGAGLPFLGGLGAGDAGDHPQIALMRLDG